MHNIQVTDAKVNCIELRVLVSARNSSNAFDLRCYIREQLIKFIKDNYPESLPLNRVVMNDDGLRQTTIPPANI